MIAIIAAIAISLTDVGGVADGETLNTEAFAKGMEQVVAGGGGESVRRRGERKRGLRGGRGAQRVYTIRRTRRVRRAWRCAFHGGFPSRK